MTIAATTGPVRSPRKVREASAALGWAWGLTFTVVFYAVLPYIPVYQAEAQRYFTAHWIEYATTGLFFVGIATLLLKAQTLPAERSALSAELLDGLQPTETATAVETVEQISQHLRLTGRRAERTHLVRRLQDVCEHVRGRRSAEGLEDQLAYLAEIAANRLHDSYALIRTITWAVPILGFLGTVIGITMAIANITPDQLETSLGEVTAGLAVAFDTTALSLALSMILVFGTFIVERQEQQLLDGIEDQARRTLVDLFPKNEASATPLIRAESLAADLLLQRTETLISWQMQQWQKSLEALRERWAGTLSQQQGSLDQALQAGLTQSLRQHAETLEAVRGEFLDAYRSAATALGEQMRLTQTALGEQQREGLAALHATWATVRRDLEEARNQQISQWNDSVQQTRDTILGWQGDLRLATAALTSQQAELHQQGAILLRIVEQEEQLVRLEDRLAQQLESARVVESLEQSVLNLNSTVNLLAVKSRAKAA